MEPLRVGSFSNESGAASSTQVECSTFESVSSKVRLFFFSSSNQTMCTWLLMKVVLRGQIQDAPRSTLWVPVSPQNLQGKKQSTSAGFSAKGVSPDDSFLDFRVSTCPSDGKENGGHSNVKNGGNQRTRAGDDLKSEGTNHFWAGKKKELDIRGLCGEIKHILCGVT